MCVHNFSHFSASPETMPQWLIKGQLISPHQWLPWYLIGTNYPECGSHFLIKCLGRSQRLKLHRSHEVFSIKSSDYQKGCLSLGTIKKSFPLFHVFLCFLSFHSAEVSVSLNETSAIFSLILSLHINKMCLILNVKTVDLLPPSQEKPSSHLCSLKLALCFPSFTFIFMSPAYSLFPLCFNCSFISL